LLVSKCPFAAAELGGSAVQVLAVKAAEVLAWFSVAGVAAARLCVAVAAVVGGDIAHKSWLVAVRGGCRGEVLAVHRALLASPGRRGTLGCVVGVARRAEPGVVPDPAAELVVRTFEKKRPARLSPPS
jgi:hypothetical protein